MTSVPVYVSSQSVKDLAIAAQGDRDPLSLSQALLLHPSKIKIQGILVGLPVEYRWSAAGWSARRAETRSATRTSAMEQLSCAAPRPLLYLDP